MKCFFLSVLLLLLSMPLSVISQENLSKYGFSGLTKMTDLGRCFYERDPVLVVGYTDPDEIIIFTTDTIFEGDVYIVNNGRLEISDSASFTINGNLYMANSGELDAENCELTIRGNIWLVNKALLVVDSCLFSMPMEYRYQYQLLCIDTAEVAVINSEVSFTNGILGGYFNNYSKLSFINDNFQQTVTISMRGHSDLDINNTTNSWEYLIADSATVNIKNSQNFILWFYFHNNTVSEFGFPQGNYVHHFEMNNTVAGLQDIMYDVTIDSTANIKWGIFPEQGSDVTINNSSLRTCGLIFEDGQNDTLDGFINEQFYSNETFVLSDRTLHLNNTEIQTFNFYSFFDAVIVIQNSVFGEVLSFESGTAKVHNSVCDGSGGYIGAEGGILEIILSTIEAQLLTQDQSTTIIAESEIDFPYLYPIFADNSVAVIANTEYDLPPEALDTSFALEIYIDTLNDQTVNSMVPVTGTVKTYNGPFNPSYLNYYKIYYAPAGDPGNITLIDSLTEEVSGGVLCTWNTTDLEYGHYIITIEAFINEDTSGVEITRQVYLWNATGVKTGIYTPELTIYPVPANDFFNIRLYLHDRSNITIDLVDIYGRKIKLLYNGTQQGGCLDKRFDVHDIKNGLYFVQINTDKERYYKKVILNE